jgi:hypothetical protein
MKNLLKLTLIAFGTCLVSLSFADEFNSPSVRQPEIRLEKPSKRLVEYKLEKARRNLDKERKRCCENIKQGLVKIGRANTQKVVNGLSSALDAILRDIRAGKERRIEEHQKFILETLFPKAEVNHLVVSELDKFHRKLYIIVETTLEVSNYEKLRSTELKLDPHKKFDVNSYEKEIGGFADQAISDYVKDRITLLVGSEFIAFLAGANWYVLVGVVVLEAIAEEILDMEEVKNRKIQEAVESCIRKSTENFVYGIEGSSKPHVNGYLKELSLVFTRRLDAVLSNAYK